jgi:hypothetical protein
MGTFKMLLGVFIIVGGLFVSVKLIPPYFSNYQFQDWVKDEATRDSYATKSEADIKTAILKKAQEYDIPLTENGIHVLRSGNQFSGSVSIQAPYVVHVDIPGYPLDLHFNVSTENKGVF